ncbi:MAG: hypothetical protein QNJ36_07665 [Calothrix sp. MO_167.B42]|nr:hypothetical protein [Calothrix sp. MO_167.B42]
MVQNNTKITDLQSSENQKKTRILLALWDLGGTQLEVKKGQLSKRIVSKGRRVAEYKDTLEKLEKQGAIAISQQGYTLIPTTGLEVLSETLRAGFQFTGSIVGTWVANALVKWIQQIDGAVVSTSALVSGSDGNDVISSYLEFETVGTQVYEQLNREYNFNHLVPIYRLRREIGERVSRSDFNEWLLEMQANDIFQLQGGTVEDSAPDKIEDSISTELDGLRCYARLL